MLELVGMIRHLVVVFALVAAATSLSGCTKPCPDLHSFDEVALRCLDDWAQEHVIVHMHHMDIAFEDNETVVVTVYVTNLLDQDIVVESMSSFLSGAVGVFGHAKRELPGTKLFLLEALETKEVQLKGDASFYPDKTHVRLWIRIEFDDVLNPTPGHINDLAIDYDNNCIVLDGNEFRPGIPSYYYNVDCTLEDVKDYDDADISLRMYSFDNGMQAYMPGPHNQTFWRPICPQCYDGWPPEKFGPVR